ncbi:MarR family transcriptional regulator [Ktedonosporobacter rubrisoli]|uniref:MarR family transcriptional regulator n=1 Tax=Ktedonosporobacter rubrisoli TaxID=2509675 RepID=A0A4P6K521_KTERU|nr:MarR family transcriptional regulator [Ktedonosporobacter rubrisoli]QBD83072.1 MarR family transcriptional regulator [Ktedonosporobacter rubrisoli]
MEEKREITTLNRTPVFAWLRMARIVQKVQYDANKQLRPWNLTLAQFDVLAQVGTTEGMTQQELAASLLVTKGNISQLLDKMELAGLLVRKQEKGRAFRIYLTEEGLTLFAEVVPAHEDFIMQQFLTLSSQEQAQLLSILRKLDHALKS